MLRGLSIAMASLLAATPGAAQDDPGLRARLEARFAGDRTGACVVVALVDPRRVSRARFCARAQAVPPDDEALFEIGSITKTMTAYLVAEHIAEGRWTLDDPIAAHLPAGTTAPRQGERQILLRDLLTHSSGLPALPSRLGTRDEADPYAQLTEQALLASLAEARLEQAIGSRSAYSNFGMMLVSLAVARSYGGDLEAALKTRLFGPLGMKSAYIAKPPPGARPVQGHLPSGAPTPPWTILPSLAGIGMVKASLEDMILYAQAHLDRADTPQARRLQMTRQPLAHGWGMNWALPTVKGRPVVTHEGGTGGFSSLLILDLAAGNAVVILADTSLVNLGGLSDLGLSLLGIDVPVQAPRVTQAAPEALRQAMVGDYEVAGVPVRIRLEEGRLIWQDPEQGRLELLYDSAGDFYPAGGQATLRPLGHTAGPVQRLRWSQGGGQLQILRKPPGPAGDGAASAARP